MGEIHILMELQHVELKLEKVQKTLKELPVFEEFKKLQSENADAKEALGWAEDKLKEYLKRIRRLEGQLQSAEQEYKENQERLYSDAVQNAKELEQLERKVEALHREQQNQEEIMLTAMEGTEELEKALTSAKDNYVMINKKLRLKQKTGNEEISRLKEEIRFLREQRELLLQQVSKPLLDEYREMRTKYNGRPLATVENDICCGCRVGVSSSIKAMLLRPDSKAICENCGRILVPAEG